MILRTLISAMLLAISSMAIGQTFVRLTPHTSPHALYLDLDHVYDYNLYEGHRVGLGLAYAHPVFNPSTHLFESEIYGAYGFGDEQPKYGASVGLRSKAPKQHCTTLAYSHDIEYAANHRLEGYTFADFFNSSSYLSYRCSAYDRIEVKHQWNSLARFRFYGVSARFSKEHYLFDHRGPLYKTDSASMPSLYFGEVIGSFYSKRHIKFEARLGGYKGSSSSVIPFARLIGQYANTLTLTPLLNLDVFSQIGTVSMRAPYSRQFDLGGSNTLSYYYRNTFLTILPHEFTAQNYALTNIRLYTSKPIYKVSFSSPSLFAQVGLLWGCKWTSDDLYSFHANASYSSSEQHPVEVVSAIAPDKGLVEPALGIDNLLRYRSFSVSIAAAYRLTPASAQYNRSNSKDNLALLAGIICKL